MSDTQDAGTVGIMVRVQPELRRKVRDEAARRNTTQQALIIDAIRTELARAALDRAE